MKRSLRGSTKGCALADRTRREEPIGCALAKNSTEEGPTACPLGRLQANSTTRASFVSSVAVKLELSLIPRQSWACEAVPPPAVEGVSWAEEDSCWSARWPALAALAFAWDCWERSRRRAPPSAAAAPLLMESAKAGPRAYESELQRLFAGNAISRGLLLRRVWASLGRHLQRP